MWMSVKIRECVRRNAFHGSPKPEQFKTRTPLVVKSECRGRDGHWAYGRRRIGYGANKSTSLIWIFYNCLISFHFIQPRFVWQRSQANFLRTSRVRYFLMHPTSPFIRHLQWEHFLKRKMAVSPPDPPLFEVQEHHKELSESE
jgi:hypothetical protein